MKRFLVADGHPGIRTMIRNLIDEQPGWQVIAEASNGLEAVEKAKMDCPDLAILEMSMSKMNGIEAARQIVTSCPRTIILADNFHDFRRFGDELSKSGIQGFVLKSRIAMDLVPAIAAVLNGGTWFDERRENG